MLTTTYSDLRQNLKKHIDDAQKEPILITRKDKSVVLLSLEQYSLVEEYLFINRIKQRIKAVKEGKAISFDSVEDLIKYVDEKNSI